MSLFLVNLCMSVGNFSECHSFFLVGGAFRFVIDLSKQMLKQEKTNLLYLLELYTTSFHNTNRLPLGQHKMWGFKRKVCTL